MPRCQATKPNGKRCKMQTPGKWCHHHIHAAIRKSLKADKPKKLPKKSMIKKIKDVFKKKPKGILKKPSKTKKIGRFFVKKSKPKKQRNVSFDENPVERVVSIRANDCPRLDRPKRRRVKMTPEEVLKDARSGVMRTKKYVQVCRKKGQRVYITKNGYDCCKTFNKEKR